MARVPPSAMPWPPFCTPTSSDIRIMPANLISVAIAWLATHLVSFSLLGFLLVGLFLAGVIGMPGKVQGPAGGRSGGELTPAASGDPGTASARPDRPQPKVNRYPAAARPGLPNDAAGATTVPGGPARKQPRLIGGSLPMYDRSKFPTSKVRPVPGEGDGFFRPPGEGSLPGPGASTRDDLLQGARRAFWNGDFEVAEAAYMALLAEYPADADGFGELGNLYQAMGKPQMALDAYYEAAVRLQAAGERERLTEVVELLRREGDERADRLKD